MSATMCNLYRLKGSTAEIAQFFDAEPDLGANFGEEVYPAYPGLVVAERQARVMTWGFPRVMLGNQGQKLKPKAVTNAREDKLHTADRRMGPCLFHGDGEQQPAHGRCS